MPEARRVREPHATRGDEVHKPHATRGSEVQEPPGARGSQAPTGQRPDEGPEPGEAREGRDGAAVRQFIQRFASLLADSGMPRMPARIFVALLTADTGRLTADELAGLLQVSPAAVSGGVRYLVQVGLVSRETEPRSRRHVYRMPDNVWHEVLRVRDRIMMRWADTMRDGAELLGAATPAGARLAESAMYFDFVSKELPAMLDRWAEYKAAHGG